MMKPAVPLIALALLAVSPLEAFAQGEVIRSEKANFRLERVAGPLEHPWGLAFLPDGSMLVTERPGRMRLATPQGRLSEPLKGLPAIYNSGQGGLLDVLAAPDFAQSRRVYFSYSEPGEGGVNGTAIAHARLSDDGTALEQLTVIFRQLPKFNSRQHFGNRLAFAPDGTLFATLGDRGSQRDLAQDLGTHIGKIVRINPDGSVPKDNPFVGRTDARPEIYSYGHRNPQGLTIHPETGQLWEHEHGARGGDEINLPQPGLNYGWPVISYGVHYSGAKIGEGQKRDGMEQPIHYWDPSIAPSGMAFYTGDTFPGWKGNLFVGALVKTHLARLEIDGDRVVREERLLEEWGERIRDVRAGPDGAIYLLNDHPDAAIWRLVPVE